MPLRDESGAELHDEAALLAWYASGTLRERERRALERHLATCEQCRAQLQSVISLRGPLREAYDGEPAPAARVRQAVFAQIRAAAPAPAPASRARHAAQPAPSGSNLEHWLRTLLSPHWAPAAVLGVLLAQAGLLVWMRPGGAPTSPQVVSRGLPAAAARLRLVFNPLASETQIRELLRSLDAHIVNGPTAAGSYVIELRSGDAKALSETLQGLRSHTDIVRSIDTAPP
jgi:anti-sigma factor RsiW